MSPSRSLRHSVARNGARKPARRPWPAGIAGKRPRLRLVRYPRTTWAPEAGNGLRKRFLLLPCAGLKAMGPSDFRRGGLAVTVIPSSAFPGAKDRGGKCGGVCVPGPREPRAASSLSEVMDLEGSRGCARRCRARVGSPLLLTRREAFSGERGANRRFYGQCSARGQGTGSHFWSISHRC